MPVLMATGREMRKQEVFMNSNGQIVDREKVLKNKANISAPRFNQESEEGKGEEAEKKTS